MLGVEIAEHAEVASCHVHSDDAFSAHMAQRHRHLGRFQDSLGAVLEWLPQVAANVHPEFCVSHTECNAEFQVALLCCRGRSGFVVSVYVCGGADQIGGATQVLRRHSDDL